MLQLCWKLQYGGGFPCSTAETKDWFMLGGMWQACEASSTAVSSIDGVRLFGLIRYILNQ
jgi:hypothetical protein